MRMVQMVGWHIEVFAHAAVNVHTKHFEATTAVGQPTLTGMAGAAFEIGAYRHRITDSHVVHVDTTRHHFDGEFVAENARITKKRLITRKCV